MAEEKKKKKKPYEEIEEELFYILILYYGMLHDNALYEINNWLYYAFSVKNYREYQLSRKNQLYSRLKNNINTIINKVITPRINDVVDRTTAVEKSILKETLKQQTEESKKLLLDGAIELFENSTNQIADMLKQNKENLDKVKSAILKQVEINDENGIKVVVTKGGNKWGYKEYMEMATRTAVHNALVEYQLKQGKKQNQVFYICNVFGDCAYDHLNYQGLIYYDKNYASFNLSAEELARIKSIINSKKLVSYQDISDGTITLVLPSGKVRGVLLCTRCNCRHRMFPITIDDAENKTAEELVNEKKIKKGTYRDDAYMLSQELRRVERTIRKFKFHLRQLESFTKQEGVTSILNKKMNKCKTILRRLDLKANDIVKESKGNLKRNPLREDQDVFDISWLNEEK